VVEAEAEEAREAGEVRGSASLSQLGLTTMGLEVSAPLSRTRLDFSIQAPETWCRYLQTHRSGWLASNPLHSQIAVSCPPAHKLHRVAQIVGQIQTSKQIISQNTGPSRAICANPVKPVFERHQSAPESGRPGQVSPEVAGRRAAAAAELAAMLASTSAHYDSDDEPVVAAPEVAAGHRVILVHPPFCVEGPS
jgi:hypothetical protein